MLLPNDLDDLDHGGNNLQNFPIVTLAGSDGSITKIKGSLNSSPGADHRFRLEFFANPACDSSGYGEGKTFIGATELQTALDGQGTFDVVFPVAVPLGHFVTATATQPAVLNGQTYNSTSEFSQCTPVVELFTLTVVNGTGSGQYEEGAVVNLSASDPPAGRIFDQWTGDTAHVADVNSPNTTVTMSATDVTVTAIYKDEPVEQFTLTVNSGTGSGRYGEGTVVDISANAPAVGKVFNQWTGDTAHVTSVSCSNTTVTMPSANVTVTATYKDEPAHELTPDIKVNGSDEPVVVTPAQPLVVTISLYPGEFAGYNADWWVAVQTPFAPPGNWYSYVVSHRMENRYQPLCSDAFV